MHELIAPLLVVAVGSFVIGVVVGCQIGEWVERRLRKLERMRRAIRRQVKSSS
jgi:uncharacterized integral membrane protein